MSFRLCAGEIRPGPNWLITDMLPGRFPFEELGTAVLRVATETPADLDEDLRRDERGLARATKRMLPPDGDLLLVIDQFEELFTLTDEATREAFLAALTTLVTDERSGARVIVTIRADYFDRPLRHPGLGELLRAGTVPVGAPSVDELLAMVTQPAAGVGVDFESGLAEHIVSNVADQPGGLPLLEYALTELFEARSSDEIAAVTYQESGGVLGSLGRRAESTFQAMQPDQQEVAQQTFLRLVSVDESGRHTRRRVRRSELEGLEASTESVDAVLAAFGQHRLLTFDRDPVTRGRTIEVAHEALFSEWQRLGSWIDEQREDLLLRRRLADEVQEWEESGRADAYLLEGGRLVQHESWSTDTDLSLTVSDKDLLTESRRRENERRDRRRRRRRGILIGFAAAAVIALVLATVAFISRQDAQDSAALALDAAQRADQEALAATAEAARADQEAVAARAATEQANVATLISRSGELNEEEPEVALLLALEAQRRAPGPDTQQAVLNALSRSLLGTRIATFDRFNEEIVAGDYDQISRDGLSTSSFEGDVMFRRSLVTGEAVEVGLLPEPDTRWVGDQDTGRRYAGSLDATRHWFSPYDGPWGDPVVPDQPMHLLTFPGATFAADRLVFMTPVGTYFGDGLWDVIGEPLRDVFLVDATTGEPVGAALEGLVGPSLALSSDNELIAVSSARASTFGDEGAVFVLDADTGTEIFHMQVPAGVAALVIDTSAREVVAGTDDGRVITIDLDAQEIVADVAISAQSQIADVGLRPDGRVVVEWDAKAELVDRRLHPSPEHRSFFKGPLMALCVQTAR